MANDILVLGAGELGIAVLKSLAARNPSTASLAVLLRPQTISSASKVSEISALRALGIAILPGDVARASVTELANLFRPYDLVISCLGFASRPGSQVKIGKAVLQAEVKRYFPWKFGVDYDIIGRGSAQTLTLKLTSFRIAAQSILSWRVNEGDVSAW